MPFASQAQRRFMYARHPEIAARWRKESGPQRDLPQRTGAPPSRKRKHDNRQKLIEQFVAKHQRK
jgi:hypothetical protein